MQGKILPTSEYWSVRKPYDQYLPSTFSEEVVQRELEIIQKRFRRLVVSLGPEGDAWEFPGHYQHVRVFYIYVYSHACYVPLLADAVNEATIGFDNWIVELECYSVPGAGERDMILPIFLKGEWIFDAADTPSELLAALGVSPKQVV